MLRGLSDCDVEAYRVSEWALTGLANGVDGRGMGCLGIQLSALVEVRMTHPWNRTPTSHSTNTGTQPRKTGLKTSCLCVAADRVPEGVPGGGA